MATTIDENVVEMRFDNDQFESGVNQTLGTIDKLKQALKFDSRDTGLENLAQTTSTMDLSRLEASALAVQSKFSALGTIGDQVLRRITDGAITAAKNLVSMINAPLNQIKTGGWSRAMNIDNAQFSLEGLGVAWSSINKDLQYAVNQTAYGLDAAANAASQLVASGVKVSSTLKNLNANNVDECAAKFKGMSAAALIADGELDQMSVALRAISGVASQTNSEYSDIANVFTRVAGQGRVMASDLNSLAARGMNAAAILGNAIGKSEADVRDMVSDGKISFEMFSEAMYDAFADHAIEANNTFTGALANMKAALSKIGADFYQPLLDELPALFNSIRININNIRSAIQPFIELVNQILKVAIENLSNFFTNLAEKTSVVQNVFSALGNVFITVLMLIMPVIDAFREVYNVIADSILTGLESASESFLKFSNSLVVTSEGTEKIKTVATGLFTVLQKLGDVIRTTVSTVVGTGTTVIGIIIRIASGLAELAQNASAAGQPLDSLRTIFSKIGSAMVEFKNNLVETFGKIGELDGVKKLVAAFKEFKEVIVDSAFAKISSQLKEFAESLNIKVPKFDGLLKVIDAIASKLADFINFLTTAKKSIKINTDGIQKSFNVFITIKDIVANAFGVLKSVFGEIIGLFKGFGTSAKDGFVNGFIGSLTALASSSKSITMASTGLTSIVEFIQGFLTNFNQFLMKMQMTVQSIGTSIGAMLSSMAFGIGTLGTALLVYNEINSKNLLAVAAGIGILALSMIALTSVPEDKLGVIVAGMAVAFTVLAGALIVLNNGIKSAKNVVETGTLIKLRDMIINTVSNFGAATKIKAISSFILKFAIAIGILSVAMYALAQCDISHLAAAMTAVIAMFLVLYAVTDRLLKNIDKMSMGDTGKFTTIATGMIMMAVAIGILSSAVVKLSSIASQPEQLVGGLLGVVVLLVSLTAVAERLSKLDKGGAGKIIAAAAGLILLAAAVNALVPAVNAMAALSATPEALGIGLLSVAAMMAALVIAAEDLSKLPDGGAGKVLAAAAGLLILSVAIKVLSSAVSALGNTDGLAKGLIGLTVILAELVFAAEALADFGGGEMLAGAASILLLSIALGNLVVPLGILGSMSLATIGKGLAGFAGALAVLIIAGISAKVCSKGLIVLSGAILAIGVGVLAAGAGVLMFATGLNVLNVALATIAAMAPAQLNSVIMSFTTFLSGIFTSIASISASLVSMLTAIIAAVIQGIVNNITNITQAIGMILDAVLALIIEYVPKIGETVVSVIVSLVQILAAHVQDFVTAGMNFLIGLLNGFASRIGDLVQAGWNAVISLINAMADGFAQNGEQFKAAVMNLIAAVADFLFGEGAGDFLKAGVEFIDSLREGFWSMATDAVNVVKDVVNNMLAKAGEFVSDFVTAGKNFVIGLINGITSGGDDTYAAGVDLASAAETGITDEAEINSPSRVTYGYGQNIGDGMINGMDDKQGEVYTSGGNLAQSAVNGASDVLDKGKEFINSKIEDLYNSSATAKQFFDQYGDVLGFYKTSTDDATESTESNATATEESTKATSSASKATSSASKSTSDLAEEQKRLKKYTEYSTKAMNAFADGMGRAFSTNTEDLVKNTQAAFSELAEQLYQDTLKDSDAIEDASQTAADRAKAVQEAFISAFESVRDSAKDTLDFFSSFDKSLSDVITPKEMLSNFESQSKGIEAFYSRLQILAGKGFSFDIIKSLMDEGTSAYPKVVGMLKATAEEVEKLNAAWDSKEAIANQAAVTAMVSLMTAQQIKKLKAVDTARKESVNTANDALSKYKKAITAAQEANLDMEETLKMVQEQAADTGETLVEAGPQKDLIDSYNELQEAMTAAGLTNEELQEAMLNADGFQFQENQVLTIMNRITELQTVIAEFEDIGTGVYDTTKSLMESSISYFDEWTSSYDMTAEKLMANVQSQVQGVGQMMSQINQIVTHEAGARIFEKYGDQLSAEIVNAMSTMGDDALTQLESSLDYLAAAPVTAATAAQSSWLQYGQIGGMGYQQALTELATNQQLLTSSQAIGTNVGQGLVNGMAQMTEQVSAAGTQMGTASVDGVATGAGTHSPSTKTYAIGQYLDQGLMNGMRSMSSSVLQVARTLGDNIVTTFRQNLTVEKFASIGRNICRGLIEGMNSESWSVIETATSIATTAYESACAALGVYSPSRKMKWVGQMFDQGFANGIADGGDSVQSSVTSTMQEALQTAVDLLDSTGDMQPTIRPIVDLSDAQNGSRLLSSMFDSMPAFGVRASLGNIVTPTDRMNAAIQGMGTGSASFGDTVINITAAPGQDEKAIADKVIKRLNNEYARRKAAWT